MPTSDFPAGETCFFPEVATVQRFSLRKYTKSVQTYIPVCSAFGYWEHIENSFGLVIFERSTFPSRSPARALAAGLPHQDHISITTDELYCFHNDEFDELPCKLDSTENLRSFEKL